jgi:peptide/nickel transport system substrate-binding protein/oligopeptide transport system substrate-binding protein
LLRGSDRGDRGGGRGASPLLGALLIAALLLGAVSPVSATDKTDVPAGQIYRRPLGNEPSTLDPARINDVYGRSVAQQIFDGLVQFDQTLTIVPALAQFWKSSRDGLTWTFTLRKGIRFHHGREVTADDVVYSLTRILDPRNKSGAADLFTEILGAQEFRTGHAKSVAGLVATDRYTVQVSLKEAQRPFVTVLAVGQAKIVPRDVVEQRGEAFGSQPVGTGPFKFEHWERGKEIVLGANPEYYEGPPKLSKVVYRIFPGDAFDAMYEEFRRGHLDDTPIPTQDYRAIVGTKTYLYVKRPMLSVRFYGFNMRVKPLDDRRVRQALIHAIDREGLIEEVFFGRYAPAHGILPPGTQGFNPGLKGYAYDPDKARELLARAGYPEGRGLSVVTIWSSVKLERVVQEHERIKKYLAAVGVRAEVQYLTDWPAFSRRLNEGASPVFLYAWFADVPDPENFLAKLFHSKSPRNFFGYANPTVDDLFARARQESDPKRRVDLYRRAEKLILDDAPPIPSLHYTYERLFQPNVRNVEVSGLGDPYIPLRKVSLERRP